MALSTEIEAKSPEDAVPEEIALPSMEPVPAERGTPGLFGWLSRPASAVKISLAVLLFGAIAVLLTPLAFPPRAGRLPPPLPPRAPARRPPHRPSAPLPDWMRVASKSGVQGAPTRSGGPGRSGVQAGKVPGKPVPNPAHLNTQDHRSASVPSEHLNTAPIQIHEPSGAVAIIAPQGVSVGGRRVPSEWAREVRRLLAAPPVAEPDEGADHSALRLLAPDPGDADVFDPPERLRWSPVPGVGRYMLTLEVLTDPAERIWHPVRDLFLVEVSGAEFRVPAEVRWVPGDVYRWRVQTGDGRAAAAGQFRVLSEAQRARLTASRQELGGSRLLRAAIYRSFGLNDAALTELRTLRGIQPANPALQRAMEVVQTDIRRQRAAAAE